MTDKENLVHPSGDNLINALSLTAGILGDYVRSFPGRSNGESASWVDEWFLARSKCFIENVTSSSPLEQISDDDLRELISIENATNVKKPVKILSIHPYFFRGFRGLENPIPLSGDLIVIDGPNSSGKTSITEAFEWLITGELLRRSLTPGNARELENCICNQLRPDGEDTWVEAVFKSSAGEQLILKRVLGEDYGCTKTSTPKSTLLMNGIELSKKEESKVIEDLFAGEYPVLMQHSLRLFINSTPTERRGYFERLLHLDELTYLIEKSVVGDAAKANFIGSADGVALTKWRKFKTSAPNPSSRIALHDVEGIIGDTLRVTLKSVLMNVAQMEFSTLANENLSFDQIQENLKKAQQVKRHQKFPLLEDLRPKKVIDEQLLSQFSSEVIVGILEALETAYSDLQDAINAASDIKEAQIAIAEAYQILKSKKLLADSEENQTCPFCKFEDLQTFTPTRNREIQQWRPIQGALEKAYGELDNQLSGLKSKTKEINDIRTALLPTCPEDDIWNQALADVDEEVKENSLALRILFKQSDDDLLEFDQAYKLLYDLPVAKKFGDTDIDSAKKNLEVFINNLDKILGKARSCANQFKKLEEAVSIVVSDDPDYDLRKQWLDLVDGIDNIVSEIRWEQAKDKAQSELVQIREILKSSRKVYLENRRVDFSSGINSVWKKLRNDRFSVFNDLRIPPPSGKGYPVEIQIKAMLDDGSQQVEVDALRVFSESQINVLGISAFITRSRLIGHKLLVIDDPVQSMDEDHFQTFAEQLIPYLLDEGFQIIILTHNDKFARDISHKFIDNEKYITMSIRHSRRKGCTVEEGNRRVAERLKKAERYAEDGEFDRAWLSIRKAMERLYLVTYIKYGPLDFNPHSWQDQTADYMWGDDENPRVSQIIEKKIPGTGYRLKEILDMSVAGAHDKSPRGFTDIMNAINDLRPLLSKLRIAG